MLELVGRKLAGSAGATGRTNEFKKQGVIIIEAT